MLDKYLEPSIQNKLRIFYLLRTRMEVSIKELNQINQTTQTNTFTLLNELKNDLWGLAEIRVSDSHAFFSVYENVSFLELLHALYRDSNILRCLSFLTSNTEGLPFSVFIDESFLSKSAAYRVRQSCANYLRSVGLFIQRNRVSGEEYRIRFLIALLYYKYGFDCCGIDQASVSLARTFVLSSNSVIDRDFLEYSTEEYSFFECLLILTWKRKKFPPVLPGSGDMDKLKEMFFYKKIKQCFKETIEKELTDDFTETDYDYVLLCYCCTNNCVLSDKWTRKDIEQLHQIVLSAPAFKDLLNRLSQKFGNEITRGRELKATLVYFYKKSLLELQCLIPDKHFYLHGSNSQLLFSLNDSVTLLLKDWKAANKIQYEMDPGHTLYLTAQLGTVLSRLISPVTLVIVSDIVAEIESARLVFSRLFSPIRVTIVSFQLNAEPLSVLQSYKNSLFLVYKKFDRMIRKLGVSDSNVFLTITSEMAPDDIEAVRMAVLQYEINESYRLLTLSENTEY